MPAFVVYYARAFADVVIGAKFDSAAIDRQLNDFLGTWDGSKELREVFEILRLRPSRRSRFWTR